MAMRYEDIDVTYSLVFDKLKTERPQSCAGVEYQNTITASYLDARGIAAVTNRGWTGTGNASSNAPEPNSHRGFQHSGTQKFTPRVLFGMDNNVERRRAGLRIAEALRTRGDHLLSGRDSGDPSTMRCREVALGTGLAGKKQALVHRSGQSSAAVRPIWKCI